MSPSICIRECVHVFVSYELTRKVRERPQKKVLHLNEQDHKNHSRNFSYDMQVALGFGFIVKYLYYDTMTLKLVCKRYKRKKTNL